MEFLRRDRSRAAGRRLRADEVAFHDGIEEALEPARRAALVARVAQLRTEERVIGQLHEVGAT